MGSPKKRAEQVTVGLRFALLHMPPHPAEAIP
jgi:hypothetical protein